MDLFGRKKRAALKRELLIASQDASYWENQYKETVNACLENDSRIQKYLQNTYAGKYFKFDLLDESDQAIQHKVHVIDVSYSGGMIKFKVLEGEKENEYPTYFDFLHLFKQISKKTYLS